MQQKKEFLPEINEWINSAESYEGGYWLVVAAPFGRVKVEFRKDTRREQQQQQKAQQWHFFYVFLGKYTHWPLFLSPPATFNSNILTQTKHHYIVFVS